MKNFILYNKNKLAGIYLISILPIFKIIQHVDLSIKLVVYLIFFLIGLFLLKLKYQPISKL